MQIERDSTCLPEGLVADDLSAGNGLDLFSRYLIETERRLSQNSRPGFRPSEYTLAASSVAANSKKALAKSSSSTTTRVGSNYLQLPEGLRPSSWSVC